MRKTTFVIGFTTGYVLGARAGRMRYEQIAGQVRRLFGTTTVQEATSTVQTQAGHLVDTAKKVVGGKLGGGSDGVRASDNGVFATTGSSTGSGTGTPGVDPYPT